MTTPNPPSTKMPDTKDTRPPDADPVIVGGKKEVDTGVAKTPVDGSCCGAKSASEAEPKDSK